MTSQKDNLMKSFIRHLEALFNFTLMNKEQLTVLELFENAVQIAADSTEEELPNHSFRSSYDVYRFQLGNI